MNVSDLFPESSYLKSEDVENAGGEMLLTIASVSRKEYVDESNGGKKEVKGELTFTEIEKKMALNVTNTNVLVSMYGGQDIDKVWIGKQIILYIDNAVKFQNKLVKGLRIRLVDPKQDAVTAFWATARKLGLTQAEGVEHVKQFGGDFVKALESLSSHF
jgi:hypothetical protein